MMPSNGQRLQAVVGALAKIDKFNSSIAFDEKLMKVEDREIKISILHFGLGIAYFLDESGKKAGYMLPGDKDWVEFDVAEVGVTGTMPDPKIKVFKYDTDPGGSSTEIADNDDYTTQTSDKSADVSSIQSNSTSLYGWPVINAKCAALLMELDPGYYTVQLISESSSNDGVSWIGIDDVTD